ncbi:MAG: flagellar basal body P-ring formation chaperone FlgA [Pseudomonadota bacterium]
MTDLYYFIGTLMAVNRPLLRPHHAYRQRRIVVILTLLTGISTTALAATSAWQALPSIRQVAVDFVTPRVQQPGREVHIVAGELDSRLRLPRCTAPLEAYLPPGGQIRTQTAVGVRCHAPKWKLFVPVRIGTSANVWVAARPLTKGAVVSADDLRVMKRDLGSLRTGYVLADQTIEGQVVKRAIDVGQALRPQMLSAPIVVRRGQSLTISAGSKTGPIHIRMAGQALADGQIGQRIRVKNLSSGRTIEGIVRSRGRVEIPE